MKRTYTRNMYIYVKYTYAGPRDDELFFSSNIFVALYCTAALYSSLDAYYSFGPRKIYFLFGNVCLPWFQMSGNLSFAPFGHVRAVKFDI